MRDSLDIEIDRNLFAFLPQLPSLMSDHEGDFAVLRDQKIIGLHQRLSEALAAADAQFPDGIYSIQQVTDKPVELGFYAGFPG